LKKGAYQGAVGFFFFQGDHVRRAVMGQGLADGELGKKINGASPVIIKGPVDGCHEKYLPSLRSLLSHPFQLLRERRRFGKMAEGGSEGYPGTPGKPGGGLGGRPVHGQRKRIHRRRLPFPSLGGTPFFLRHL